MGREPRATVLARPAAIYPTRTQSGGEIEKYSHGFRGARNEEEEFCCRRPAVIYPKPKPVGGVRVVRPIKIWSCVPLSPELRMTALVTVSSNLPEI
jgi:hypothetical protein